MSRTKTKLSVTLNVGTLAENGNDSSSRKWDLYFTKSEFRLGFGAD